MNERMVVGATPGEVFVFEQYRHGETPIVVLRQQFYKQGHKSHCHFYATVTEPEARHLFIGLFAQAIRRALPRVVV